ncbi:MAG: hypothetical protein A3I05_01025 [Deltaproteobacteria bacterium RIFCSPLOWO2_02_FULL_44_10]|nr:MAG: hypothetical protein A3C46_02085 [Deltaproteobacteria bacterium RIFCSPHIGHO2_02_FULL_44_16]OGQ45827.1 MAG: hypothetical protein A3I05_01025 [Deltaproteobacteria bacterium RIFCSPLOWO2_02_FULL_44_10]
MSTISGKISERDIIRDQVLEGWKEIGHFLGRYSARHARRLFYPLKGQLKLKYWLGPRHRIKMLHEEIEVFKALIEEGRSIGAGSQLPQERIKYGKLKYK